MGLFKNMRPLRNIRVITAPKAFAIRESDSIEDIDKMQIELKETIKDLQNLYDGIAKLRAEKAFKEAFDE